MFARAIDEEKVPRGDGLPAGGRFGGWINFDLRGLCGPRRRLGVLGHVLTSGSCCIKWITGHHGAEGCGSVTFTLRRGIRAKPKTLRDCLPTLHLPQPPLLPSHPPLLFRLLAQLEQIYHNSVELGGFGAEKVHSRKRLPPQTTKEQSPLPPRRPHTIPSTCHLERE
ncbi:hypothetical protein K402DRAFT_36750 [Aulographum hederae CBS 113979]|uniref:Uncharacterized protein n=1 Tax=Aulographum hederae CBS 113979 TaxID=1176131 RepID=A0A6G1H4E4_9PEZI|nr:hypothetical protein K402DRAFT_36750 [Aulographum hederae CBS 113979]